LLFYLKFGWESNTKKVEDFTSFPMGIYLSSSDQRFRFYDFLHDDGFAENYNYEQIAVLKENKFWGCLDSSPELNNQSLKTENTIFLKLGLYYSKHCISTVEVTVDIL
jgi:hypothetical protein